MFLDVFDASRWMGMHGALEEGACLGEADHDFLVRVVIYLLPSLPHITNDTYSEHGVLKT